MNGGGKKGKKEGESEGKWGCFSGGKKAGKWKGPSLPASFLIHPERKSKPTNGKREGGKKKKTVSLEVTHWGKKAKGGPTGENISLIGGFASAQGCLPRKTNQKGPKQKHRGKGRVKSGKKGTRKGDERTTERNRPNVHDRARKPSNFVWDSPKMGG